MKTSDRELLELAAKAADYQVEWDDWHKQFRISAHHDSGRLFWEPLTDDGDVLRLAGKLRLRISISDENEHTEVQYFSEFGKKRQPGEVVERWQNDRNAATRRAIVRAAAEIEKQSK